VNCGHTAEEHRQAVIDLARKHAPGWHQAMEEIVNAAIEEEIADAEGQAQVRSRDHGDQRPER
jgi:hypothetical protein